MDHMDFCMSEYVQISQIASDVTFIALKIIIPELRTTLSPQIYIDQDVIMYIFV